MKTLPKSLWALFFVLMTFSPLMGEPSAMPERGATVVRIGAVAYAPSSVTVFQGLTRYLNEKGFPCDFVLYSNYDALIHALEKSEIQIAWNTPLAHAQYCVSNNGACQTLVMRDVDFGVRSTVVVQADSGIESVTDLSGRRLILGSSQAAESTVLPIHFLRSDGVDFDEVDIVSLDHEFDSEGNPCASPWHVLEALRSGRGEAGIITTNAWEQVKDQPSSTGLEQIWTSPPFSHCVFTAAADFDPTLADDFIQLMTAMNPEDPRVQDVMRLEGTKKWLRGSPDGFADLVDALQANAK